jgi:uncharacterized membrane protein YphA (DoxX/SURF4 family)
VKTIAIIVSILLCIAPATLATWAWVEHFEWQRNGDYSRNSFPMESFAIQMTWITAAAVLTVLAAWCIVLGYRAWAAREQA